MKFRTVFASISLLILLFTACSLVPNASETPMKSSQTGLESTDLFFETDIVVTPAAKVLRSRVVRLNTSLLLDEGGKAYPVEGHSELVFNLFPGVSFTGIVQQIEYDGDGYTWSGYLKDVEYSHFNIVYTGGIFIVHVASPAGVYEASNLRDDLYLIVEIDQSRLDGGEG